MRKLFPVSVFRLQLITVLFFAVVYSLLSLVNHYNFRTYAFDLGLMNNAMYDYAHFHFNYCTLLQPELKNYLSVHFELFNILLSPFSYLFGTYTLLIFQIAFVLFGGFGVYSYVLSIQDPTSKIQHPVLPFLAQLHFYFFYGIYSALSFDFHNNVIGAMLVPWFFYFFHKKKWKIALLFLILIVIAKENMPLWMAFVSAGLAWLYRKEAVQRNIAILFSVFAFACFFLIIKIIMPSLANQGEAYGQIRISYSALGSSIGEIATTFFADPVRVFKMFFSNHTGNSFGDNYKMETYVFFILSGGILLFLRPQFLLMLLPIFAQKMFHNDFLKWGIGDHYSIEFAPICSIGIFYVITKVYAEKWRKYLAFGAVVMSLVMTIRSFDRSYTYFDRDRHRMYQARHYQKDYNVQEAYDALKLIPDDASVCAQSPFVPHLALRDGIWQFPYVQKAEYVVFSFEENPYPLSKKMFEEQAAALMNSPDWNKVYDKNRMVILKRK